MSGIRFTDQQQKLLSQNIYVAKVSDWVITYSEAFKIHAINEYPAEKALTQIFRDAGFDTRIIGSDNPKHSLSRWRNTCSKTGIEGLKGEKRGHNKTNNQGGELTLEEQLLQAEKKVLRIMKKYGLVCKIRRKKLYRNTFSEKRIEHVFSNQLNTTFDCMKPDMIFHTDITYIKYAHNNKTAYLSAAKDGATREIPAFKVSRTLEMPFVMDTLQQLGKISLTSGAIIHSDQGVHYTSNIYKEKINEIGLSGSMSRRCKCVDNSPIETFFGHMKDELNFRCMETYEEVVDAIGKYIYKYNNLRPQWTLKKMTPREYRNHLISVA